MTNWQIVIWFMLVPAAAFYALIGIYIVVERRRLSRQMALLRKEEERIAKLGVRQYLNRRMED